MKFSLNNFAASNWRVFLIFVRYLYSYSWLHLLYSLRVFFLSVPTVVLLSTLLAFFLLLLLLICV